MAPGASAPKLLRRSAADTAAVVVLAASILAVSAAPAATAKRGNGHQNASTAPAAAEPAGQQPSQAATPVCCTQQAQPPIQTPASKHRKSAASAPAAAAPQQPAASSHGEGKTGQGRQPAGAAGAAHKRHGRELPGGEKGNEDEAASAAAGSAGGAATPGEAGKREHPRRHRSKGPAKGRENETLHTPQPLPVTTPAQAPPATGQVAAASAPVTTSAASAVPPVAAPTPPAIVGEKSPKSTGARHHTRVASGTGAGTARRATAPAAAGLAALAAGTEGARGEGPAHRTPAGARHTPRPAESPIVKTVTRIIGVVPPLVRGLIAALALAALLFAVSSRVAALRARRLARQRSELLEDVGLLQAALLPPLPERVGPVATSAAYQPASGPGAGGDFYDVFALGDGQVAVIVGDVSGHGRSALPHTTLVRYTLRAYLEAGLSPRLALQAAAPSLERQLGDSFATVALATYHPRDRVLVYACAGHPPPLVMSDEPIAPLTACSAPPIGVGQTTGTRQSVVSIPGGALVCLYTDGVVEARVRGHLYGAGRLEHALEEIGPDGDASTLLDNVARESDQRPDDMAACMLRIEGEACMPEIISEELELDAGRSAAGRAERFLLAAGVDPIEIEDTVTELRATAARHGRVVLELRNGDGAPEVSLRPQNVAIFEPHRHEAAVVRGVRG